MRNPKQVWQQCQPCTPKEERHQRSSAFKISAGLSKRTSPSSSKVLAIANTMKTRMKAAVNTMLWKEINYNHKIPLSQFVSPSSTTYANVTPCLSNRHQYSSNLKNHSLLKQYLAFVQEETSNQLEVDPSSSITALKNQEHHVSHPLAFSGAALIEYMVHSSSKQIDDPIQKQYISQIDFQEHQQSDSFQCPSDLTRQIIPEATAAAPILTASSTPLPLTASVSPTLSSALSSSTKLAETASPAITATGKSTIRCICDAPQEEFGAMVQCDDCTNWLHLDCLEMDESSLGESFRCPICYVTLGPGQHTTTTSGVSWRFAAHLRAKRLATRYKSRSRDANNKVEKRNRNRKYGMSMQHADDGSDTDLDDDQRQQKTKRRRFRSDRSCLTTNDRLVGYDSFEQQNRSYTIPKMTIDPSIITTMTNSSGNVLFHSSKPHTETDTEDMDSATTESDSDPGNLRHQQVPTSSSMSSITSAPPLTSSRGGSDTDTPSEASTLDNGQEFLKYETTANGLEQSDIDRSLWLAYLESSQQPGKNPCFATHSSDVFLGGYISFPRIDHLPSLTSAPDSPPSTLCSDQLNEFIFNAGPFWNSIQ